MLTKFEIWNSSQSITRTKMRKAEIIEAINAQNIKDVNIDADTEITVPVLKLVLKGAESDTELAKKDETIKGLEKEVAEKDELIDDLSEEIDDLSDQVEKLKSGDKRATLPTVEFEGEEYEFRSPKFRLPKSEPTTAQAVADRGDEEEIEECIKRGALVLKEKEG